MSSAQDLPPSAVLATRTRASLAVVPDIDLTEAPLDVIEASATAPIEWDELEFETVVRSATPRLVRFAQRRLGNLHEAEEVAQEALLRTYQHRHTLATENDVMAWATFASNRLVIDRLRVRGRSISVAEVPEGRRVARDTAEIAEARAEARLALDALDALPARQAAVLWAREVEGSTYEEISERFGLSEPTVRSLLHRARKALRREYASRGGTLFAGMAILGPWLNPLNHARRLRAVAGAALATTALGFAGLSAIGIGGSPLDHLQSAPHVAPTSAVNVHMTPRRTPTIKTSTARPTITTSTATVGPFSHKIPVRACASGVGFNCATPQKSRVAWVATPDGGRIYVGSDDVSCAVFDTVPKGSSAVPPVAGCSEVANPTKRQN